MPVDMGYQSKLAIAAAEPAVATDIIDFDSSTYGNTEEFIDTSGMKGIRDHSEERVRGGFQRIGGDIVMRPTPKEFDIILPWILGGTKDGSNVIALAETLPDRFIWQVQGDELFKWSGNKVNTATFRAEQGGPLTVTINAHGKAETVGLATSFPAGQPDITHTPYMIFDCVLTINAVEYKFRSFELTVDNVLDLEQFRNSASRLELTPQDRNVTVNLDGPYGDFSGLYNLGTSGGAVIATFTQQPGATAVSLKFDMAKVQFPRQPIGIPGRTELFFPLRGVARRSGTTASLIVTNDSTE